LTGNYTVRQPVDPSSRSQPRGSKPTHELIVNFDDDEDDDEADDRSGGAGPVAAAEGGAVSDVAVRRRELEELKRMIEEKERAVLQQQQCRRRANAAMSTRSGSLVAFSKISVGRGRVSTKVTCRGMFQFLENYF
jgi:hypothetical protein